MQDPREELRRLILNSRLRLFNLLRENGPSDAIKEEEKHLQKLREELAALEKQSGPGGDGQRG
jgi:hypothetical protein